MSLYVKINANDLYNFLALYDSLGKKQQKIWQLIVWWCKRFPCAKPCQATIARKAGCGREHVNRTFQKFMKYGWLDLVSRGIKKSKILTIPQHLLQMDIAKREYFKRVEVTSRVTHSCSMYKKKTSDSGVIEIPEYVKNLAKKMQISREDQLKLGLFPQYIYQETIYKLQKKAKSGFKPDNEIRYFVNTGIRMAEQRGIKLNWRAYYNTLKMAS